MLLIATRMKGYPILNPFVNGRKERISRFMGNFFHPILDRHISLLHLPVIISVAIATMLDSLEKVIFLYALRGRKIGYCPGQAEGGVAGAGREVELRHRESEGCGHPGLEPAEAPDGARRDSRVPVEAQAAVALALKQDGSLDPGPD